MQMYNTEHLQEKWGPILDYDGVDPIKDAHRRNVTAILLENQEKELREEASFLSEQPTVNTGSTSSAAGFSAGATAAGPVAGFDPVLISLIRRSMPNLVAYDLAGVQPMNGPTGLIFAMRSRFKSQTGSEALFNEPDSAFSGQDDGFDVTSGWKTSVPIRTSIGISQLATNSRDTLYTNSPSNILLRNFTQSCSDTSGRFGLKALAQPS